MKFLIVHDLFIWRALEFPIKVNLFSKYRLLWLKSFKGQSNYKNLFRASERIIKVNYISFTYARERISWAGCTSRGLRSKEPEQVACVSWWQARRRKKAWPTRAPPHYFCLHHRVQYAGLHHGWWIPNSSRVPSLSLLLQIVCRWLWITSFQRATELHSPKNW